MTRSPRENRKQPDTNSRKGGGRTPASVAVSGSVFGARGGPRLRISYQPRSAFTSFHVRRKSQMSPVVGTWLLVDPTIIKEPPAGVSCVQS
jgi:hypothetical protein